MVDAISFENFFQLKRLSDSLRREPTVLNVWNICEFIENLPNPVLQNSKEYFLLPAVCHLKSNVISDDVKLQLLNLIDIILSRVRIMKIQFFTNLYIVILRQIHEEKDSTAVISGHEELKLSVIGCLRNLFARASMSVIELLYVRENALKLSQIFFICLSIAKYEKFNALRISAIETLMTLSYIHDEADANDCVLRSQVADVVMLYFPGMVRGMLDVCQGSDVQHHKVTLMAVRALGRVIALVMEDIPDENPVPFPLSIGEKAASSQFDLLKLQQQTVSAEEANEYLKTAHRNQEWLDAASSKLTMLMKTLKTLTEHSHCKVREELFKTVSLLLIKCPKNMKNNFSELVDVIIVLSEDDMTEVKEPAQRFLDKMTNEVMADFQMRSIVALLEEKFYQLLIKLPRIIRSSEDAGQLAYLNQLIGYLRILGRERLPRLMSSVMHLRRLLLALIYIMELDCQSVPVLGGNQLEIFEDASHLTKNSWKTFKFIRDCTVENKLMVICRMLGELGDFYVLVDSILELMSDMPGYRKEATLLLNWIAVGPNDGFLVLYEQIINHYIDPEVWYLPVEVEDDVPLCEVQSNIVQCCLLTEGLGVFAEVLQNDYQEFLLATLYLIIERAGSKNELMSLVGLHTLEKCANSLKYTDICSLLRANMDYISYHVTVKLRRLESNVGVLDVVTIVMKYSTLDVIPSLSEIVIEALSQLDAAHQGKNTFLVLNVLHTFVASILQQNSNLNSKDSVKNPCTTDMSAKVIDSLRDYCEAKKCEKMIDEEFVVAEEDMNEEFNNKIPDDMFDADEKVNLKSPPYINIVEDVVKSSLNFISSKSISESLLAMRIVQDGIRLLASCPDQLLPLIHKLWFPLVQRFKEKNVLIINQAWQLFYTVTQVAEDFVRTRTVEEISPAIGDFLKTSADQSYLKDSKDMYKFTQMFKLQRNILSQFGLIAEYLKLNERQLWKLLSITEPYLNDNQHSALQACCIDLYKTIFHLNKDILWVKCLSIQNSTAKDSTKGNQNKNSQNLYEKNTQSILNYIDEMTNCTNI